MADKKYLVGISPIAIGMLAEIDGSVRKTVAAKIDTLEISPSQIGKPLTGDLMGFYRVVAAGRYRAIYRVKEGVVIQDYLEDDDDPDSFAGTAEVVCIGIRKGGSKEDAYYIAKRMLDSGEIA